MATFYGPRPIRTEVINGNSLMVDYVSPEHVKALQQALEHSQPEGINPADFIPFTGDTTPNPE